MNLYGVRTADIYLLPSREIHVPTEVGYSESKMGALLCSPPTNQPTDHGTLHVPTYPPDLPT